MNPVSRITVEGRADFRRSCGHGLDQKGAGLEGGGRGGGGRGGGRTGGKFVRGSYKSFKGINMTVFEKKNKKHICVKWIGAVELLLFEPNKNEAKYSVIPQTEARTPYRKRYKLLMVLTTVGARYWFYFLTVYQRKRPTKT